MLVIKAELPCLSRTPPPPSPTPESQCRWPSRESCGPLTDRTEPPSQADCPSSPLKEISQSQRSVISKAGWRHTQKKGRDTDTKH